MRLTPLVSMDISTTTLSDCVIDNDVVDDDDDEEEETKQTKALLKWLDKTQTKKEGCEPDTDFDDDDDDDDDSSCLRESQTPIPTSGGALDTSVVQIDDLIAEIKAKSENDSLRLLRSMHKKRVESHWGHSSNPHVSSDSNGGKVATANSGPELSPGVVFENTTTTESAKLPRNRSAPNLFDLATSAEDMARAHSSMTAILPSDHPEDSDIEDEELDEADSMISDEEEFKVALQRKLQDETHTTNYLSDDGDKSAKSNKSLKSNKSHKSHKSNKGKAAKARLVRRQPIEDENLNSNPPTSIQTKTTTRPRHRQSGRRSRNCSFQSADSGDTASNDDNRSHGSARRRARNAGDKDHEQINNTKTDANAPPPTETITATSTSITSVPPDKVSPVRVRRRSKSADHSRAITVDHDASATATKGRSRKSRSPVRRRKSSGSADRSADRSVDRSVGSVGSRKSVGSKKNSNTNRTPRRMIKGERRQQRSRSPVFDPTKLKKEYTIVVSTALTDQQQEGLNERDIIVSPASSARVKIKLSEKTKEKVKIQSGTSSTSLEEAKSNDSEEKNVETNTTQNGSPPGKVSPTKSDSEKVQEIPKSDLLLDETPKEEKVQEKVIKVDETEDASKSKSKTYGLEEEPELEEHRALLADSSDDDTDSSGDDSQMSSQYHNLLLQFDPSNANNVTAFSQDTGKLHSETIQHADGTRSELRIRKVAGLPTFVMDHNGGIVVAVHKDDDDDDDEDDNQKNASSNKDEAMEVAKGGGDVDSGDSGDSGLSDTDDEDNDGEGRNAMKMKDKMMKDLRSKFVKTTKRRSNSFINRNTKEAAANATEAFEAAIAMSEKQNFFQRRKKKEQERREKKEKKEREKRGKREKEKKERRDKKEKEKKEQETADPPMRVRPTRRRSLIQLAQPQAYADHHQPFIGDDDSGCF